jgi:hypothetical protein
MTTSVSPTASAAVSAGAAVPSAEEDIAAAARGEEGTAVRTTGIASSASTSTGDGLGTASGASA